MNEKLRHNHIGATLHIVREVIHGIITGKVTEEPRQEAFNALMEHGPRAVGFPERLIGEAATPTVVETQQ